MKTSNKVPTLGANTPALQRLLWLSGALALSGAIVWELWPILAPPAASAVRSAAISPPPATGDAITPIPDSIALDPRKIALGDRLFHDTRFSRDNSLSCASCHVLEKGGGDGRPRSIGINGQEVAMNAPSVFNSGYNVRQFWDGRAATLEDQIEGPVHNQKELGSDWTQIIGKLAADPQLVTEFKAVYPEGIRPENIKDAIATFERALVTPNSRFDRHLKGNRDALSADEIRGYQLFKSYGCVSCHQGVNVGGNIFAKLGVMRDYFKERGGNAPANLGRYNVTGQEEHKHVFKVPSLRNVAVTGPYFHDGSVKTLEEAVLLMGRHQLDVAIPQQDIVLIVNFLHTLTGQHRGKPL